MYKYLFTQVCIGSIEVFKSHLKNLNYIIPTRHIDRKVTNHIYPSESTVKNAHRNHFLFACDWPGIARRCRSYIYWYYYLGISHFASIELTGISLESETVDSPENVDFSMIGDGY